MKQDHHERARLLLNDLIEYTGRPEPLVRERCKYAVYELAWLFEGYKDRPLEYYRDTDLYIFDLTKHQTIMIPNVDFMISEANDRKFKKVLDLGGGIGEYTIRFMQEAGCEATYLDLANSKTAEYASWRFKKHGVSPKIVDENYNWHDEEWDAVIAMDVIEHMEKPVADKALEALRNNVKYVYTNSAKEEVKYNEYFPQHITRFDMHGFRNVEINLYQNINK